MATTSIQAPPAFPMERIWMPDGAVRIHELATISGEE
jgi:hypothetical protein